MSENSESEDENLHIKLLKPRDIIDSSVPGDIKPVFNYFNPTIMKFKTSFGQKRMKKKEQKDTREKKELEESIERKKLLKLELS